MKILTDTNILIAASRYPTGIPCKALLKASASPNTLFISEQNLEELRNVYNRLFPHEIHVLESFLAAVMPKIEIIPIPAERIKDEKKVRHAKDRPILRAAIAANVDIIVTGDKDFLEAGLTKPKIMSPADFVDFIDSEPNKT